jgi:hypothetical protein
VNTETEREREREREFAQNEHDERVQTCNNRNNRIDKLEMIINQQRICCCGANFALQNRIERPTEASKNPNETHVRSPTNARTNESQTVAIRTKWSGDDFRLRILAQCCKNERDNRARTRRIRQSQKFDQQQLRRACSVASRSDIENRNRLERTKRRRDDARERRKNRRTH